MKILFIVAFFIFLQGCASTAPKPSRDEWIQSQNRIYKGITKEQILKAAETVFILSDENDFNFSYKENGLTARRNWMIYAVFSYTKGTDIWEINVQKSPEKIEVTAELGINTGYFGGGENKSGARSIEDYKIFWDRLEFLLGIRKIWPLCDDYPGTWTNKQPSLCGPMVDDKKPDQPLAKLISE